ncbi:hypothetical protein [Streptomyces incanus]|uniref:Uncharacterized protein n=1 Tax=Streptomyces incanus TaxID=887453 RepID=A0ABW0XFU7_9ACTN
MTHPHSVSVADDAVDGLPGPNQWFKDHLNGLIDAHLLADWPETRTGTADELEKGLLS